MREAFICDAIRTPIGRYGGGLATIRADDLGAIPFRALMQRQPNVDWAAVEDVIYGCANQAGEDNRDVARMSVLLSGLPIEVPGTTINRLCGSGMDAIGLAARSIKAGETDLMLAGGVESMSARLSSWVRRRRRSRVRPGSTTRRSVGASSTPRCTSASDRTQCRRLRTMSLPTSRSAGRTRISSLSAHSSAGRPPMRPASSATRSCRWRCRRKRASPRLFDTDEHPRPDTTLDKLAKLKGVNGPDLSVTAGNSSGVNDGACALLLASEPAARRHGLIPKARVVAMATAGVPPRVMGIGPAPASRKVLAKADLSLDRMDVVELNEAFAAQALAVLRDLGLPDDAPHVNPSGGAIAMGHPLGMSGARLVTTAINHLHRTGGRYALCTMCIGVGQGIATVIERV